MAERNHSSIDLSTGVTTVTSAEEALVAAEERFRTLLMLITDVGWIASPDGRFVTPQPVWERFTGQAWDEHRGLGWIKAIHPDDRAKVKTLWDQARGAGSVHDSSGRLWRASMQQWRDVDMRVAPRLGPDGHVCEWIGTCTDVTERRQTESQRERLLLSAQERASICEKLSRRKDDFLAVLGHELRNPLAPIVTALELMNQRGDNGCARERTVIGRQVRLLVRLVDDLRDLSKIAHGRVELRRERVRVAEVIASASDAVGPLLAERHQWLDVDIARPRIVVCGDATRLTQVLTNMLTNAAKYSQPWGRIGIAARVHEGQVELRIEDAGMGISAEVLPHVFDMFVQDRQAARRSWDGLGLGLAIVKSLVELHGGSVEARSDGLGKGSTFLVRLPAASTGSRQRASLRATPRLPTVGGSPSC